MVLYLTILLSLNFNVVLNGVQGVNICLTTEEGVYNISCDYIQGSNVSGCGYCLTGANVTAIKGIIPEYGYEIRTIFNIRYYNHINVTDSRSMNVTTGIFDYNRDIKSCVLMTGYYYLFVYT